MDGALRDTVWFNWTERWGPAFWTGGGRRLPPGSKWSWSVLSPLEDRTWTDRASNRQPVGDAKGARDGRPIKAFSLAAADFSSPCRRTTSPSAVAASTSALMTSC